MMNDKVENSMYDDDDDGGKKNYPWKKRVANGYINKKMWGVVEQSFSLLHNSRLYSGWLWSV